MSEKAATDEQVEEIQLSYAHFNKIEIEDLAALCIRINSDRARIDALRAENTALKAALDELLDWVNGERRTSDDRLAEIESMLPSKGESHE